MDIFHVPICLRYLFLRFIRVFSAASASITLSSLGKWSISVLQRKTVLYLVTALCKYSLADNLMNLSVGALV